MKKIYCAHSTAEYKALLNTGLGAYLCPICKASWSGSTTAPEIVLGYIED